MRVLHIGEYVQGGVATYIRTLLDHPDRPDIEDFLICADRNNEMCWSLPAKHVRYYKYYRSFLQIPFAMSAIHQYIRQVKPDVIYCHSTWAGFFVRFPLLFMKKQCRVIYNAHGWAFLRDTAEWKRKIYAEVEKILQRRTDVIINVSKYEYNSAIRYGLKKINQVVVYNGISIKNEEIDPYVKLPVGKINLLFVGRFDPQKGLDILLDVFKSCNRQDLHLTIIGDNVIGDGKKINKENTDQITFLGWIPHNKLASYYNACDVVVMPSRWEAFGLVAIEAMKYGKSLIVSNQGALPELVEDKRMGYVFNINESGDLNKILNRIDLKKLREMGFFNKKVFYKKYQDKLFKSKVYSLYCR